MTVATHLTEASPGAPLFTVGGALGEFITFLRWSLVTNGSWTEPFTSVGNVAVFRTDTTVGNGFYLRVDDSINIQYASVQGYRTMSDLNTGTDPFPSSPLNFFKTNGGTTNNFDIYHTGRFVHVMHDYTPTLSRPERLMFGELNDGDPSDIYNCILSARNSTNSNTGNIRAEYAATSGWIYACRNLAGDPGAVVCSGPAFLQTSQQTYVGSYANNTDSPFFNSYPGSSDHVVTKRWLSERPSNGGFRGFIPGQLPVMSDATSLVHKTVISPTWKFFRLYSNADNIFTTDTEYWQ